MEYISPFKITDYVKHKVTNVIYQILNIQEDLLSVCSEALHRTYVVRDTEVLFEKESKFKIGDKVKIKKNNEIVIINFIQWKHIYTNDYISNSNGMLMWSENELELVVEKEEKINKFKVGDKVRHTIHPQIYEIEQIDRKHIKLVNYGEYYPAQYFELVEDNIILNENTTLLTTLAPIEDKRKIIYACCDECGRKTYIKKFENRWLCLSELESVSNGTNRR